MIRQILSAGTIINIFGVPVILVNDTEVDSGTDLKWWQDNVANSAGDMKEEDLDNEE